jgi:hypothetical protein
MELLTVDAMIESYMWLEFRQYLLRDQRLFCGENRNEIQQWLFLRRWMGN